MSVTEFEEKLAAVRAQMEAVLVSLSGFCDKQGRVLSSPQPESRALLAAWIETEQAVQRTYHAAAVE